MGHRNYPELDYAHLITRLNVELARFTNSIKTRETYNKKRAKKAKIPYLPADRQEVWLDICEKDKREFALLFATLLQTGMRPEERMWFKMEMCFIQ